MDIDDALRAFAAAAQNDLSRLLMAASRATNEAVLREVDPTGRSGVRLAHVPLIAVLDPGGTRIGDLASRIGVTRQAVAALAKDLEAAGMVTCLADPDDGRATVVRLTAAGAEFCTRAVAVLALRETQFSDLIGASALAELKRLLSVVAEDSSSPGGAAK